MINLLTNWGKPGFEHLAEKPSSQLGKVDKDFLEAYMDSPFDSFIESYF